MMCSLFLRIYADVILVIVNATLWKLNPFKMREITLPAKMRHHALPATGPASNGDLLTDQDRIEAAWAECAAQVDMIYKQQQATP